MRVRRHRIFPSGDITGIFPEILRWSVAQMNVLPVQRANCEINTQVLMECCNPASGNGLGKYKIGLKQSTTKISHSARVFSADFEVFLCATCRGYSSSCLAEVLRLCLKTALALRKKLGSAWRQRMMDREIWSLLPCRWTSGQAAEQLVWTLG